MDTQNLHYYQVAVPCPLYQAFTYSSKKSTIAIGTRVLVPFGSQKVIAVVVKTIDSLEDSKLPYKIKSICECLDDFPLYSKSLIDLGFWLSKYYHTPLGEVFKAMLPQAKKILTKTRWSLCEYWTNSYKENGEKEIVDLVNLLFNKKNSLSEDTIKQKIRKLEKKEINPQSLLNKLMSMKIIQKELMLTSNSLQNEHQKNTSTQKQQIDTHKKVILSAEQDRALCFLKKSLATTGLKASHPILLHGVTGSGKTEIYLQLIHNLLKKNEGKKAQTLVMVPEISLTPQMTDIFSRRFPNQVCVVHSGLNQTERYKRLLNIRHNNLQILIGPRSSVFAPFDNLRLLIVDEEHDSSYKQNNKFSYNGRDVAVLRAKFENALVVLGSATPSLESYQNALDKKYHLLSLEKRVCDRPMPTVSFEKVESKLKGHVIHRSNLDEFRNASNFQEKTPICENIIHKLQKCIDKKEQAIVIVNRRGYAYYLFNLSTKKSVQCPNCHISLTLHNKMQTLSCHYCDLRLTTLSILNKYENETFAAIGFGSEKTTDTLKAKLPQANIVRLDSDTSQNKENLEKILADFRSGKIDILVGTQILAKGHDFPDVTLLVLLELDEQLHLPDFRAGEKTFQLLVQAAGRAGRSDKKGHVIIQSSRSEHPLLKSAISHDYNSFLKKEMRFRKVYHYPPFSKMILLDYSSLDDKELFNYEKKISKWLKQMHEFQPSFFEKVKVIGPTTPSIARLRKRYRRQILLISASVEKIHLLANLILEESPRLPTKIRLNMDVDPQSLL